MICFGRDLATEAGMGGRMRITGTVDAPTVMALPDQHLAGYAGLMQADAARPPPPPGQ